jgi:hypothetical protein
MPKFLLYLIFVFSNLSLTSCAVTGEWLWREASNETSVVMPDGRFAKRLEKCHRGLLGGQYCSQAYGRKDGLVVEIPEVRKSIESFLLSLPESNTWELLPRDKSQGDTRTKRVPYRLQLVSLRPVVVVGVPRGFRNPTSELKYETAVREDNCPKDIHCIYSTSEMITSLSLELSGALPAVEGAFWFSPDAPRLGLQYLKPNSINQIKIGVERALINTTGQSILVKFGS